MSKPSPGILPSAKPTSLSRTPQNGIKAIVTNGTLHAFNHSAASRFSVREYVGDNPYAKTIVSIAAKTRYETNTNIMPPKKSMRKYHNICRIMSSLEDPNNCKNSTPYLDTVPRLRRKNHKPARAILSDKRIAAIMQGTGYPTQNRFVGSGATSAFAGSGDQRRNSRNREIRRV
jgi:hypothetical protein